MNMNSKLLPLPFIVTSKWSAIFRTTSSFQMNENPCQCPPSSFLQCSKKWQVHCHRRRLLNKWRRGCCCCIVFNEFPSFDLHQLNYERRTTNVVCNLDGFNRNWKSHRHIIKNWNLTKPVVTLFYITDYRPHRPLVWIAKEEEDFIFIFWRNWEKGKEVTVFRKMTERPSGTIRKYRSLDKKDWHLRKNSGSRSDL